MSTGGWPAFWAAALMLAILIALVYGRSLKAPFIFDDTESILDNPSITSLWPLIGTANRHGPLVPPPGFPLSGRPLVNLSFAINYHFGGSNPVGYHAVNILIHYLSAVLIWAITWRTLRLDYFEGQFTNSANRLALLVAILWALHPLQTGTVVYTTQRTELMMAFLYLAVLYCSLRYWSMHPGADVDRSVFWRRVGWLTLAVLASFAGMASKEVMVSAPLVVLLFDRTFISGSLSKAVQRTWPLYVGLASTWLLLIALNFQAPRRLTAGFGLGVSAMDWWLTQTKILLMYLKLTVWPWPLLIHYEIPYLTTFAAAWMYFVPVMLLGIVLLALLWRNYPSGFLGTCAVLILAPTSVVPIVTEMAAERRMYLPLAALIPLTVTGTYWLIEAIVSRLSSSPQTSHASSLPFWITALPAALVAICFGFVSANRLAAYNDEIGLWREVTRAQPQSPLAHNNLGYHLNRANQLPEAIAELRTAIELKSEYPFAHKTLGSALLSSGRLPEAVDSLKAALALAPDDVEALNNLGIALMQLGQLPAALDTLHHAVDAHPNNAEAHNNLGQALSKAGRLPEAINELQAARALKADDAVVLDNLGIALTSAGRLPEAIEQLEHAVQVKPDFAEARADLAIAQFQSGQVQPAIKQLEEAVKLSPNNAIIRYNLANLLAGTGNLAEAVTHFKQAVRLAPNNADYRNYLADTLRQLRQFSEAVEQYREVVRLNPALVPAYFKLAQSLAIIDRPQEATAAAQKGVEVARSGGEAAAAEQIEDWLKHYQAELLRTK